MKQTPRILRDFNASSQRANQAIDGFRSIHTSGYLTVTELQIDLQYYGHFQKWS